MKRKGFAITITICASTQPLLTSSYALTALLCCLDVWRQGKPRICRETRQSDGTEIRRALAQAARQQQVGPLTWAPSLHQPASTNWTRFLRTTLPPSSKSIPSGFSQMSNMSGDVSPTIMQVKRCAHKFFRTISFGRTGLQVRQLFPPRPPTSLPAECFRTWPPQPSPGLLATSQHCCLTATAVCGQRPLRQDACTACWHWSEKP